MKSSSRFAVLAVSAMFALFPAKLSAQESGTFRIANFSSSSGGIGQALERYAEHLDKVADGRLNVEVFHGSSMGPALKHFDLVKSGVADMAIFVASYTPGRYPKTDIFTLPNLMPNAETGAAVTELLMQVAPDSLYAEFDGVRMLWLAAAAQDRIFMHESPARSLDDIKGKRIRVTSGSAKEVLRAVGADPVSMPAGEVAESLQKNVIDGVHTSRGSVWTLKIGELLGYQTPLLKVHVVVGLAINPKTYDNLPPDLQKAVDDLGGVENAVNFINAYEEENPVVNAYMEQQAIEAIEPDASLTEAVAEASRVYNEAFLAKYDDGRPEMRELFNQIRKLDQEAN